MQRDQAINLVNLYDGEYPEQFIDTYLSYYKMNRKEFDQTLDKWANKDLFQKTNGYWEPKFVIK